MLRFVTSQLRFRPGRAAALAAGILVADVAFTILTASAQTSAFRTRGTITRNYRTAYDILVRPKGSATPIERSEGLVRNNYLSGIYGGITFAQYHRIQRIAGVAVAAPIANIGYIYERTRVRVSIKAALSKARYQLYRGSMTWVANGRLSHYPAGTEFVYYSRNHYVMRGSRSRTEAGEVGPGLRGLVPSCFGFAAQSAPPQQAIGAPVWFTCAYGPSFESSGGERGFVGVENGLQFPIAVSAIDPAAEAKLVHLDRAVVKGRYFLSGERLRMKKGRLPKYLGGGRAFTGQIPVIASNRPYVDEHLELRVTRLRPPHGASLPLALATGACRINYIPCPPENVQPPPRGFPYPSARAFVLSLRGPTVLRRTVPIATLYRSFLDGWAGGRAQVQSPAVWRASPVRYRRRGHRELAPRPVHNPADIWRDPVAGLVFAPVDNEDIQFRRLYEQEGTNFVGSSAPPRLRIVGHFDPRRLPGFSPLSRVPLETYYPPELEPADAAARAALHGRPFRPTQNLGGYVAQPPLLLTTLGGLRDYFLNPTWWAKTPGGAPGVPARIRRAPLSVVRVRVAGVKGPDPVSRERVRVVAQRIHQQTGLDVDVTVGSSPHPLLIALPKGRFGQPPLLLREGWSKKGVSLVFLRALDRKSLGLFALVVIVCSFFLANGAFAVTRTRRAEIGTLRTLGWSKAAIFGVLLGELALVGLAAGLAGTALSLLLVWAFSLRLAIAWTLLVLPLSLLLACLSALVPAWRAARVAPLAALRPAVSRGRSRRPVACLAHMALVNLRRLPARSLVGAAGLAIGIAALTLLLAIERSYHGTLVGTLLGKALALQVRGADLAAVALVIALAACSVADVLYLNLRERAAELVTLRASGWSKRQLALLVALEAAVLGLCGSLAGAALGVALTALLLSLSPGPLLAAAALAALGGTLAAVGASLLPLSRLRRLTAPAVLAAE
jgi:hypothetical protein